MMWPQWLSRQLTQWSGARHTLYVDLGSAFLKYQVDGQLAEREASWVAWHDRSQSVVAWGNKAFALVERTPAQVQTIRPVRAGVVADTGLATAIFLGLKQAISLNQTWKWQVVAAYPDEASPVEQTQLRQALQTGLGCNSILLLKQSLAIEAAFQSLLPSTAQAVVIVLGSELISVLTFAGHQLRRAQFLRGGVSELISQVKSLCQSQFQCLLGWPTAQKMVMTLLSGKASSTVMARGKQALTNEPMSLKVAATALDSVVQHWSLPTMTAVQVALESLLAESDQKGTVKPKLYVTGGGANLGEVIRIWSKLVGQEIQVLDPQPEMITLKGLALKRPIKESV